MVNLPLGSTAALRLVGSASSTSGWLNRYVLADGAVTSDAGSNPSNSRPANFYTAPLLSTASGVNSATNDSFRAILLYKPNDRLTITPMIMWQQGKSRRAQRGGRQRLADRSDHAGPEGPLRDLPDLRAAMGPLHARQPEGRVSPHAGYRPDLDHRPVVESTR